MHHAVKIPTGIWTAQFIEMSVLQRRIVKTTTRNLVIDTSQPQSIRARLHVLPCRCDHPRSFIIVINAGGLWNGPTRDDKQKAEEAQERPWTPTDRAQPQGALMDRPAVCRPAGPVADRAGQVG